ncbi:MAG: hypothetical protein C0467_21420 [Planctomycetaceae bacterium]|nr:hypothetical protein [Planctomycetaceae bacterium]
MRNTSTAALFAAPLLLAIPSLSFANPPGPCFGHFGCGGTCVSWFSKLHQHGPLFNYGPYYGYPPFEPYGPWNAYLQYNPYYYGQGGSGRSHGHCWSLGGKNCGVGGCGIHAGWKAGGWFKGSGSLTCGHHKWFHGHGKSDSCSTPASADCSTCKTVAYETSAPDVTSRYAGAGAPESTAVFYAGLPSLDPTLQSSIVPAGR